ncbi:hypothetical protein JCGZ_22577 [Jatropha curcas]|uniref:DNA2/NAM7 helicase helicase domain-containing protein n=1 Tax=Jatropha curcas TaxID=180498 RepID=A0A067JMC2_JATCU|nr:hypothetical protein JCGZ_22577 [Jatropha curcas]
MAKIASRRELLDRWRGIEETEEEQNDDGDPLQRRRLHKLKEEWFADTFNFLITLPKETHIWCGSWDLMGPLLETFYNYFKDERSDSPLRLLWKRISEEIRQCVQCISQHHQAQEMYSTEYEFSSIGPLLDVLRSLDEERVTQHLREMNARLKREEYDPLRDNSEVVSLMYEVLMFPILLDDQSLITEFESFIEAVDNMHELALAGHQQFPGVYALLFFNRRVRTVGRHLARSMEKLRRAADMEPLQPLLNKFIGFLETEALPSVSKTSRPRAQMERLSIWLGFTSLLEFLEPPVFEEGILERYPIFFDIVLNHISGDSAEFSHAVSCLKELFKMLVPASSNFNVLTRKLACKIALLIVNRGYKMNPPCPPVECVHMWGPSLVSSLKDSSLHSSLRQPAFDLVQTIVASDAAALVTALLNNRIPGDDNRNISVELDDDDDDDNGLAFSSDFEEKDNSCWSEFSAQSKIISQEYRGWMCVPMLWMDVLVDIDPSVLPVSFSKAVFWARSRLTMVEPETSPEMVLAVRTWLLSSAPEISASFGWKVPTGFDDGGGGKESKNSIRVSMMHLPLIRTFNRLTAHFVVQVGQGELRKQWTWEPRMAEALILSLLDPNDSVRQVGKSLLEQVSNTKGLACGLKFLCSGGSSLSAMFLGLRHALKVVQLDSIISKFQALQHFFFILRKLIKEGDLPNQDVSENSNVKEYSSQGGFLTQPIFKPLLVNFDGHSSNVDSKSLDNFHQLLSETAWPSIRKCLVEGKAFIDYSLCQMTCVRVLEILPDVFERLYHKHSRDSGKRVQNVLDFIWLHDLIDWGKSSLKVVFVYWKRTVTSILNVLKVSCNDISASTVKAIENLITCENVSVDQLSEQVSHLRVSLAKKVSCDGGIETLRPRALFSEDLSFTKRHTASEMHASPAKDTILQALGSSTDNRTDKSNVILLSDDESERHISPAKVILPDKDSGPGRLDSHPTADRSASLADTSKKASVIDTLRDLSDAFEQTDSLDRSGLIIQKQDFDKLRGQSPADDKSKEVKSIVRVKDVFASQCKINLKNSCDVSVNSKTVNQFSHGKVSETRDSILKEIVHDANKDLSESAFKSVRQPSSFLAKLSASGPKRQVIQLKTPVENRIGSLHRLDAGVKRFKPPRLDAWFRPILEINYFETVGLMSADKDENQNVSKLKEVPVCFQSPEQYVEIFRPLVLEEFKAQLHSSFLEMSSWDEMYYGSLSVLSVERVDDFHLVRFVHDDNDSTSSKSFSENDLVLLTKEAPQRTSHDVHMVGKVSGALLCIYLDFIWLHDLIDWGKSSLKVVFVYWKRTVTSILNVLKVSCNDISASTVKAIENLITCENVSVDQLSEQVSHLRVSLAKKVSCDGGIETLRPRALFSEDLSFTKRHTASEMHASPAKDTILQALGSSTDNRTDKSNVILLSDDESERHISPAKVILPDKDSGPGRLDSHPTADRSASLADTSKKASVIDTLRDLSDAFEQTDSLDRSGLIIQKQDFDKLRGQSPADDKSKEVKSIVRVKDVFASQCKINLKNSCDVSVNSKTVNQFSHGKVSETRDSILKEIVHDANKDLSESAFKSVRQPSSFLAKLSASGPKRQVIQLKTPVENRIGSLHRLDAGVKRFKPPRLDAWFRPILEINYFETVGLMSADKDENQNVSKLKEVPVCFQSPEQYVEIFRPLVLEEFKAQLHSSFLEMSSWDEMYYGSLSVLSVERVDDFHLVRFVHDDNDSTSSKSFSENDLVLLTKEAPQRTSHDVHMVGKVERRERDNKRRASMLLIRFYFLNGSSRLNQARKQLLERSKWHASRIMSITPQLREFQVLSSIKDIPILSVILKPADAFLGYNESRELALDKLSQPLQQVLKSSFNDSQLQAISVAIGLPNSKKDFELSLIQGPPGTGKTRTILAIVSGLLASLRGTNDPKHLHSKQVSSSCMNTRPKVSQSVAIARAWQAAALARQLNEDVERNEKSVENAVRRRVLVCAQSNAAVDELVSRISSGGLYGRDGKMYKPYIVRVGNAKTVHPNSLPFFIDTLVDHRLAEERMRLSDTKNDSSIDSSAALRSNLEKLVDQIRYYEAKRANLQDGNSDLKNSFDDETLKGDDVKAMSDAELNVKLQKLYEQKKQIFKDLSAAQAREKKYNDEVKTLKHKLRKSILKEAEIVVTTLSGCGGDLYGVCSESMSSYKFGNPSEHNLFDAVVIDEAAQALEPATLIPLQLLKSYGTKCVMVGDPKQLPATVLSNVASKFLYECSMFERLQRAGYPVTLLTKQYRMHPEICRFPSLHFYDGNLLNGEQMSSKSASFHESKGLGPYVFYDVTDGQELRGKNSGAFSLYNEHEAEASVELLRFFKKRYPSDFDGRRIGIITPYKSQLSLLRSRFSGTFGSAVMADMEFNTVDGFQGREVDILIFSTVRAAESDSHANGVNSSSIGFVADVRRMNVALTRAKLSLWVFGNARTLQTNRTWAALVEDAKERNLVISVKRPYDSFKAALRDKVTPEKSGNHRGQMKHVKNANDPGKLSKNVEHKMLKSSHRNREHISYVAQCNRTVAGDDTNFLAKKDDIQGSKRKARADHDLPPVHASDENRTSKNVKCAVSREYVRNSESKCNYRSEKKQDFKDPHKGKKKDTCMNSKSDRNLEISTSSAGGNNKGGEINDGRISNELGASEDIITKRKRQREAVDAILCSSLISSKKPESSTRPVPTKKSLSPTSIATNGIRPPKKRKGKLPCFIKYVSIRKLVEPFALHCQFSNIILVYSFL